MAFFESFPFELVDHPPQSPDLNPIENLWSIMAEKVYKGGHKNYRNKAQLTQAVEQVWNDLEGDLLRKLAGSMPDRLADVAESKGKLTKY